MTCFGFTNIAYCGRVFVGFVTQTHYDIRSQDDAHNYTESILIAVVRFDAITLESILSAVVRFPSFTAKR